MGTWTCVLSLIVYRLSLSLSLCLSLPLSLSLSLLLKVENYISLKLSMFGLELLPIKLVEPMNLLAVMSHSQLFANQFGSGRC